MERRTCLRSDHFFKTLPVKNFIKKNSLLSSSFLAFSLSSFAPCASAHRFFVLLAGSGIFVLRVLVARFGSTSSSSLAVASSFGACSSSTSRTRIESGEFGNSPLSSSFSASLPFPSLYRLGPHVCPFAGFVSTSASSSTAPPSSSLPASGLKCSSSTSRARSPWRCRHQSGLRIPSSSVAGSTSQQRSCFMERSTPLRKTVALRPPPRYRTHHLFLHG